MKSNADVFRRRGDPWITQKEGLKDYGREHLITENPDMDRWTRAGFREPDKRPNIAGVVIGKVGKLCQPGIPQPGNEAYEAKRRQAAASGQRLREMIRKEGIKASKRDAVKLLLGKRNGKEES